MSQNDFVSLEASEVLDESIMSIADYKQNMDCFYIQLVRLNVNVHIIQQVIHFPFSLFVGPEKTIFWRYVKDNAFEVAILGVTKLLTDNGKGHFTLPAFKNRIRSAVKPIYQEPFDDYMKAVRFDQNARGLIKKAKYLRDNHIAHGPTMPLPSDEQVNFTIAELLAVRDSIVNKLFDALAFNVGYGKLYLEYDPDVTDAFGNKEKSDIEELLDSVARTSPVLNAPEGKPSYWLYHREDMTDKEISRFNEYRRKFGLPEV